MAISISLGVFSFMFKLVSFVSRVWHLFQSVFLFESDGWFFIIGGEESIVRSTAKWSEYKELKFSMWWNRLFGALDIKISRMSERFLEDVSQYVGSSGEWIWHCSVLTIWRRVLRRGLLVRQP
jgi:hypothetical protein